MSGVVISPKKEVSAVFDYDFKVPYFLESVECQVPYKATNDAAGYDLYAAENKEILPKTNAIVSLDLRIAIPKGFFGKIFSRSGLFLNHNITVEAGVFDSGFRGIVQVLSFNHSDKTFYAKKEIELQKLFFWKNLM